MAKGAYIGVDGKARKVKKMYIGVDGVARKIKKAYIGVGGVARPCFTGGELAYWGTTTKLPSNITLMASASTKNEYSEYAFFGGGYNGLYKADVFAYDKSLTQIEAEDIPPLRYKHAATAVGYYAIFGGGEVVGGGYTNNASAIDDYLEVTLCENLKYARRNLAATTVGDEYDRYDGIAIFAGGYGTAMSTGALSTVDVYDAYLTHSSASSGLSVARYELAATTVGGYALFGGGINTSSQSTVNAYDANATHFLADSLSVARRDLAATTVGDYALFGGGINNTNFNTVDIFDESLTRVGVSILSVARYALAATTVGDYALFAGGYGDSQYLKTVDVFDTSLTRIVDDNLSAGRSGIAAASVGNYALFAGGTTASRYSDTVDVYTVQ
jgi:hypothetical protein